MEEIWDHVESICWGLCSSMARGSTASVSMTGVWWREALGEQSRRGELIKEPVQSQNGAV